jgi:hypothetical protein
MHQVTTARMADTQSTAQVSAGPLSGLHGSVVSTTTQGQAYLQLHDLPGVTIVLPSHLLQPAGTAAQQPN